MIRSAEHADIEQIIDLGQMLDTNYKKVNDLEDLLTNKYTKIYVSETNMIINGFIQITKLYESIEIIYLVVKPESQRQKIGTNLLNYVFANCATDDSIITLEVKVNNLGAIKFYENMGFKKIFLRPKYYQDQDAIVMQRKMNNERD